MSYSDLDALISIALIKINKVKSHVSLNSFIIPVTWKKLSGLFVDNLRLLKLIHNYTIYKNKNSKTFFILNFSPHTTSVYYSEIYTGTINGRRYR